MSFERGLIHLYYGYGSGKTTAAMGLALRTSGSGKRVVIVQFLKNIDSSEVKQLESLENITVFRGQASDAFSIKMSEEEKLLTKQVHDKNLNKAVELVKSSQCDLLVLDESLDAYQLGLLDKELFESIILNKPEHLELVLTGHNPEGWILEAADYVSEVVKKKHPYDKGIAARRGIEF